MSRAAQQQEQPTEQQKPDGEQTGTDQKQPEADNQGGAKQEQGQSSDQQNSNSETTGAKETQPENQGGSAQQGGEARAPKSDPTKSEAEQSSKQGDAQQPEEGQSQSTEQGLAGGLAGSSETNVTVEQKTEITQVVCEEKFDPIDVNVGVVVPAETKVKLRLVPPRIVRIVPRYEGYLFFVLADGRIVIVEPSSLKVVVVIV